MQTHLIVWSPSALLLARVVAAAIFPRHAAPQAFDPGAASAQGRNWAEGQIDQHDF